MSLRRAFQSRFLWKIYLAYSSLFLLVTAVMSWIFTFLMERYVVEGQNPMVAFRYVIAVTDLAGVALALVVGLLLARKVTDPIREIIDVADAMRKGDYQQRVRTITSDEFGLLGITLNRMGNEITQRIATISQDRSQLKAILTGMVEGIIAVDDDDRILFANRAADQLLKAEAKSSKGRKIDAVPGLGPLLPLILGARNQKQRMHQEISIGDGEQMRALESTASPFKGEQTSGVIVVLHDVTDLRRLERVRRDFVSNVSHELKTPLTSIKGYVETLLGGAIHEPDVNVRFLKKIEGNVARLVNLVQDILSLGRIESHDAASIRPELVEWGPIIRSVVAHREDDFAKKNLRFEINHVENPVVVLGDPEAMQQVLDNLVINAIKYTPDGGRVRLTLRRDEHSRMAALEVEDTGIGIPKQHLGRIFERFYRVDKARSREMGGTGLGLSIVKNLVSAMQGRLSVESQPGVGSKFSVTLQLAD